MRMVLKVLAAIGVGAIGLETASLGSAEAKAPGREYCFLKTCHTVKTLEETRRLIGVTTTLKASFYDDSKSDRFNPSNLTSSGEYFRADRADNAASPIYPDGTKLFVWHPASRKALILRVNNAGPYWGDRKLDLSRAAADRFGFTHSGVATVQVRVIEAPTKAEATYKRGRTYPPVKGYLGQFATLDAALATTGETRLAAVTPPPPPSPIPAPAPAVPIPAPAPAVPTGDAAAQPAAAAGTTVAEWQPAMPKPLRQPASADAMLDPRLSPALNLDDGPLPRLVALAARRALLELPKLASLR